MWFSFEEICVRAGLRLMFGDQYIHPACLLSGVMTVGVVRFDARKVLLAPPCDYQDPVGRVEGITPTAYDRHTCMDRGESTGGVLDTCI